MNYYKLTIAYDGRNYSGWQIQTNAPTVEGKVRQVLDLLFKDDYGFVYSSRTDAGVHALGQVALLEIEDLMPMDRIPQAMNANLPRDIVVRSIEAVDDSFHPRYSAQYKTYRYQLYSDPIANPLVREHSYYIHKTLDVDLMRQGAAYFYGEHDFFAFSSKGSSVQTTIRTIYHIDIQVRGPEIQVYVTGNGFLYNMVRIMVGALVQVGMGFYEPAYIQDIIEKKDRSLVKRVAPAHGLTLMQISYEPYKV